ncbi:helix-turn-helix transcriptional regulator [Hathewaya histolytica]|uniref:helix-turn-helix transcriptional regulator n=1 Tax=Hathewaya histolytica TaxID=1498 RepID=UPI003B66FF0E
MFSNRLKDYRASLNLTQEEFANKSGITRGVISMLEANKRPPSKKVLLKLREFSGKDVEWWLEGETSKEYSDLSALNALLDYMVDNDMFGPNGEIEEKEMQYILKLLKEEIKIKRDRKKAHD